MIYRLTIYEADDTTVWLAVSTDIADTNPWLRLPESWAETEVDFASGSASIGEIVLEVIDPQTGGTQAQRGFTAKLADTSGRSALSGRRALLEDSVDGSTFRTIFDGVINRVELLESLSSFAVSIRDIRERERQVELFRFTESPTVLPQGVLNGYGIPYDGAPESEWLVPPTQPLVGIFRPTSLINNAGEVDLFDSYLLSSTRDGVPIVRQEIVMSDAAIDAASLDGGRPKIEILWRAKGSTGAYTVTETAPIPLPLATRFIETTAARVGSDTGREVAAARKVFFPDGFGLTNTNPAPDQEIEFIVQYIGETSKDWPFHIEGVTAGELIKDIYDGVYSEFDPRVRYDSTSILALTTPVRMRVTEPVEDMRDWVERNLYVAAGAAPVIIDGLVHAVRYELPDVTVDVTELGNAEADVMPGWAQAVDDAVNFVEVVYQRDVSLAPDDPGYEAAAGDRIVSRDVVETSVLTQPLLDSIALLGERRREFKIEALRAIGGAQGEPYSGDVADETGAQVARRIATMMTDRFALGGQTLVVMADRSIPDVEALQVGDWAVVTTTWTPDYQTGTRGGNRLGQIIARRDMSPIRTELVIIDAGPDAQPLNMPTLGTITQDAQGRVVVPIASVPTGAVARMDYAISSTQPAASSGLWTFAGRAGATASVTTPPLPSGRRVWIRARSEAVARRPSGYTNPVSIDIDATPRLRKVFAYVTGAGVEIHWIGNTAVAGVQIEYVQHAFGDQPDYDYADVVDAGTSPELLTDAFDRSPNQLLSFRVTPFPTFSGGAVSGTPGTPLDGSIFIGLPDNVPFGYVIANLRAGSVDFFAQGNQLALSGDWAIKIGTPPTEPDDPGAEATGSFEGDNAFVSQAISDPGSSPVWVGVWFYSEAGQQGERGPRVLARVIDSIEPLLFNFREVDRTDTTITYQWQATASVDQVWVYDNLVPIPQTIDPWPTSNDLPDEILTTNTYTLQIPAEGFGRFIQFEPRTSTLQPGSIWRLVVSSEGESAAVSLAKTTEEEDRIAGIGRLGVTVIDPEGVGTSLKYRTKEGAAAWSSLAVETNTPVDGVEYSRTVPLVEQHLSFIEYVLEFTVGTKNGIVTSLSAGFDAGEIPDIVVKGHVRQNGQVFAQISGDSDTRSVKCVAFRTGQAPGDIPAAVRAATALNGREVTTGDLLDQPLQKGEQAFIYAFGYGLTNGGGLESTAMAQDVVELREITAAYLVPVTAEERRNGGEVGFFEVRLEDPDGVATRVRSKVKEVASSGATTGVSAFQTESTSPTDQDLFDRSVTLVPKHASQIIFEVQSNVAGELVTEELASPIFDLGQIPDLVISLVIDANGAASVQWSGDFDTSSVKIVAWLDGDEPANIATAVRAATALNGRTGQTGTLVTATTDGQKVFAAAFGYAEASGAGYEGALEQTVGVYRRTGDFVEADVALIDAEVGIFGVGTGATFNDRQVLLNVEVSENVESIKVIWGPVTTPTGSPIQGNNTFDITPGTRRVLAWYVGGEPTDPDDAVHFPITYDVDTIVQIQGFSDAGGTTGFLQEARYRFGPNTGLPALRAVKGTTTIQSDALLVGGGLGLTSGTGGRPEVAIDVTTLPVVPVTSGGTGLDTLTSGAVILGNGISTPTFVSPGDNGNVLTVSGGAWVSGGITGAVTNVTAGEGLSGGGSGSVTLDVVGYQGTVANRGKTALEITSGTQKALAVVLGTESDEAMPGNTPIPQGTVTSVSGGNGLTGTVTSSGSISMGSPSSIGSTTDNTLTSDSHTHRLDQNIADIKVEGAAPTISDTPARAGSLWFVV